MKLSKIIAEKFKISGRAARAYVKNGNVTINGAVHTKDNDVPDGDIELNINADHSDIDTAKYLISDHGNVVFFEKPVFMHSERHKPDDPVTMEDIVRAYSPDLELISRLDYSTDGIIAAIRKGTDVRQVSKTYYAWVSGIFSKTVTMDNIINADKRKKVKVTDQSGGNRTIFTPVKSTENMTLVMAQIETASRHQLRAYLAYLGFPIIGDTLYGGAEHDRIFLHCWRTEVNNISECSTTNTTFFNFSK